MKVGSSYNQNASVYTYINIDCCCCMVRLKFTAFMVVDTGRLLVDTRENFRSPYKKKKRVKMKTKRVRIQQSV